MRTIDRRDDLTKEEFDREYLEKSVPVIIKCTEPAFAASAGGPLGWDLDFIEARCGSNPVSLKKYSRSAVAPDGSATMTLSEYIAIVRRGQPNFPRYYLKNRPLKETIPQLVDSVRIPQYVDRSGRSEQSFQRNSHIYIGRDAQTGMHFHPAEEAISLVLQGRKDFLLFAPEETRNLYANPWYTWPKHGINQSNLLFSSNNLTNGPFPRYDPSRGIRCQVGPGEMLFIPQHWWHAVYTHDVPTVMLVYWFPSRKHRWMNTPQKYRALFQEGRAALERATARLRTSAARG